MRLFVAIELPEGVRHAIAAEQRRVRDALAPAPGLKWVRTEQIHLTLVFIGEVDESCAAAIVASLERPVPVPPFALSFAGLGVFPAQGAPRVAWMGIKDGAGQAIEVQQLVAARMMECGVELEHRAFSPHLTLARWREARPSDRRRFLGVPQAAAIECPVDRITLFQSHLSSSGATHSALLRTPLGQG
jgi:2'-5' RNA ligase